MSYITKNANMVLLVLIAVAALGLAGATVYFHNNFKKVNTDYSDKLAQLTKVKQDLEQQQTLLSQVKSELQTKSSREEQFSQKFTEVRSEKEQLSQEITGLTQKTTSLEQEVVGVKADLQKKIKDNSDLAAANVNLQDQLKLSQLERNTLNNQVQQLKSEKQSLQDRLNRCLNPGS